MKVMLVKVLPHSLASLGHPSENMLVILAADWFAKAEELVSVK